MLHGWFCFRTTLFLRNINDKLKVDRTQYTALLTTYVNFIILLGKSTFDKRKQQIQSIDDDLLKTNSSVFLQMLLIYQFWKRYFIVVEYWQHEIVDYIEVKLNDLISLQTLNNWRRVGDLMTFLKYFRVLELVSIRTIYNWNWTLIQKNWKQYSGQNEPSLQN